MTTKIFLTTVILSLSPLAVLAQEASTCDKAHANCAEGTTYDAETKTCVVVSS